MIHDAPNIDFEGNSPFWVKYEGCGVTLYFPAFRPVKDHFLPNTVQGEELVFMDGITRIPKQFVLTMMKQGQITCNLQRECWLRPEIKTGGRHVTAISLKAWQSEKTGMHDIGLEVYRAARDWYRERVVSLWEEAKKAAAMFEAMREDPCDVRDAEVVPPEQIEA